MSGAHSHDDHAAEAELEERDPAAVPSFFYIVFGFLVVLVSILLIQYMTYATAMSEERRKAAGAASSEFGRLRQEQLQRLGPGAKVRIERAAAAVVEKYGTP